MITPIGALGALCLYMAVLFAVAVWAARRSKKGQSVVDTPLVYSLGLTVLCTTWTFYGSVGRAASIGMVFLVPYLGIIMPLFFWWTIVRKMVRIKTAYRVTSIADFISARYEKSAGLAALVTVFCLIGVMPYIALQLKAIISTFQMISSSTAGELSWFISENVGCIITLLMIVFTVMFGVRSLDPTERHPGMVMAIAIEGVIKLAAFHIFLPATLEPAEPAPEASLRGPQPKGKETILVVEDEEIVRQLACEALDILGYTALSAGDADEALAIGKNYENRIDLLLTDVVLPQMDGKTLYERFSRIRPHTKVLFVSGYTEDAIVRHGVLDAGVHFLAKPFTVDLLAAKIRDILDSASSPRAIG
jgi:CheY-like chemotaxis protein